MYWNITNMNGLVDLLSVNNTITYNLATPLLFVLLPSIIIFTFLIRRYNTKNSNALIVAGLYTIMSSVWLFSLNLVSEYIVNFSIIFTAMIVLLKIGGGK